jgi:hypothetical protein
MLRDDPHGDDALNLLTELLLHNTSTTDFYSVKSPQATRKSPRITIGVRSVALITTGADNRT